ncbi:uncharacterized protein LOC132534969 [Erinaceus europaeus]|uniref:Uncharacterized protein LOC132534969 n=1 Tax=Erinaceus europaeus TaxID=9365 RepID=A0ABM3WGX1_ERIEU|nr:uncharacterized protein LOC132534969 [Erinaceus europaeus]
MMNSITERNSSENHTGPWNLKKEVKTLTPQCAGQAVLKVCWSCPPCPVWKWKQAALGSQIQPHAVLGFHPRPETGHMSSGKEVESLLDASHLLPRQCQPVPPTGSPTPPRLCEAFAATWVLFPHFCESHFWVPSAQQGGTVETFGHGGSTLVAPQPASVTVITQAVTRQEPCWALTQHPIQGEEVLSFLPKVEGILIPTPEFKCSGLVCTVARSTFSGSYHSFRLFSCNAKLQIETERGFRTKGEKLKGHSGFASALADNRVFVSVRARVGVDAGHVGREPALQWGHVGCVSAGLGHVGARGGVSLCCVVVGHVVCVSLGLCHVRLEPVLRGCGARGLRQPGLASREA